MAVNNRTAQALETLSQGIADITRRGVRINSDLRGETGTSLYGIRPMCLVSGPRSSPVSGDWDPTA